MKTGPESTPPGGSHESEDDPLRIVATDQARAFIQARGGRLYVWATEHGCCRGRMTLLDVDTTRPEGWDPHSEWTVADGFEVYLDGGWHGRPEELVLELNWSGRKVRAYWNGCAYLI